MLRAFSLSLAGHAALALLFLLLAATGRQPVRIVDVPRPVRLIAVLEPPPGPSPAARSARLSEPATPKVTATPRPTAPETTPVPAPARSETEAPPPPPVVPKIAIPTREAAAPAPATPPHVDLRTRLNRRLASVTPAGTKPDEVAEPRIANLPPPVAAEPPKIARTAAPEPKVAPSAGGPIVPLSNFPYAWYLAILKEKVFANWETPSEFSLERKTVSALVSFRVNRSGTLSLVALKEGSGYRRFDQSVLTAVQSIKDIPLLPEDYREEHLDVVIRFQNTK